MTISDQVKRIKEALRDWALENKAVVELATGPVDFFQILRTGPGRVRVAILFRGETKRGEYEESGVVERKFMVGWSRGEGLQLNKADSLISDSGAGPALFDVIQSGVQALRGVQFDAETTEVTPDYKGTDPLEMEGWIMDAMSSEIWIGTQLPAVA